MIGGTPERGSWPKVVKRRRACLNYGMRQIFILVLGCLSPLFALAGKDSAIIVTEVQAESDNSISLKPLFMKVDGKWNEKGNPLPKLKGTLLEPVVLTAYFDGRTLGSVKARFPS